MERCEKCNFNFVARKIEWHRARCPGLQCKICFQVFSRTRWTKRHKCPDYVLALRKNFEDKIKIIKHTLSHAQLQARRSELAARAARQNSARLAREVRLLRRRLNKNVITTQLCILIQCSFKEL